MPTESFPFNYMLKSKFSLSHHFEYANEQITYHFWLWRVYENSLAHHPGADPGFQVRGGGGGALKKIAPSGGRRENFWGISYEKSRFYAPPPPPAPLDPPLPSIFKAPNVAKHLSHLHDKYIVIPADKAPNNIVFVCKSHFIDRWY